MDGPHPPREFMTIDGSRVQTIARSASGTRKGPWTQLDLLVRKDHGPGILFETFEGS